MDIQDSLDRINTHRDRFTAWGLVIGFLSFLAAMWAAAPTLQIEIPLLAGAKANLNAGYVLAVGPAFIALSLSWAVGALMAMYNYQISLITETNFKKRILTPFELITILGPLNSKETTSSNRAEVALDAIVKNLRTFVFFVLPVLAQLVINSHFFMHLVTFDEESSLANLQSRIELEESRGKIYMPEDWRVTSIEIQFSEYLLGIKENWGDYYYIQNSGVERDCAQYYMLNYLSALDKKEASHGNLIRQLEKTNAKCVAKEYPQYELRLNALVNLFFLILTVAVSWKGAKMYIAHGLANLINCADSNFGDVGTVKGN